MGLMKGHQKRGMVSLEPERVQNTWVVQMSTSTDLELSSETELQESSPCISSVTMWSRGCILQFLLVPMFISLVTSAVGDQGRATHVLLMAKQKETQTPVPVSS